MQKTKIENLEKALGAQRGRTMPCVILRTKGDDTPFDLEARLEADPAFREWYETSTSRNAGMPPALMLVDGRVCSATDGGTPWIHA